MFARLAECESSVLAVVDVQPAFMKAIWQAERVLARTQLLLKIANALQVPALATEQNPTRMGGTDESVLSALFTPPMAKMAFSCAGCESFLEALQQGARKQVVLVGIETHICISQTALQLAESGFSVFVCEDAVSANSEEKHRIGLERLRCAGIAIAHTESIAYEWMRSAEHPAFREVLNIVKEGP